MVSKEAEASKFDISFSSTFISKKVYKQLLDEFNQFHRHDVNALLHFWTTGLGVWGAIMLALNYDMDVLVYIYAATIALTTPLLTGFLHTALVAAFMYIPQLHVNAVPLELENLHICAIAIAVGYLAQDLVHFVCQEKTFMNSYIGKNPPKLLVHSIYLMPLVIDGVLERSLYLPWLVTRNRNFIIPVASQESVDTLRKWIHENIAYVNETTHVWPHKQDETSAPVKKLEDDAAVYASFRKIFAEKHFDIKPIQGMNEIYITATGAKKAITSDAVFYTPHVDGPYFWTPWASCYRCLVGVTPNKMVQTKFNLQHKSEDQVLGMYDCLGFDYNRELHWISHVEGAKNDERRSVIKLHYVVYPRGWHWYGNLVAKLNQNYNTWARGNFLRTLNPSGLYEHGLAWWIWFTTWFNAFFVEYFGWDNLFYIGFCYALGPLPFLILTSFRHYAVYMSTFAFRSRPVAHGYLMRDAKLYKTIALCHLGRRLLPLVMLPRDLPGLCLAVAGFGITMLATARLGFVRTYFGSELGFVEPKWIEGFPYGYIPHPMIVGQLFAYSSILWWWSSDINFETTALIATHMSLYTIHMVQEMLTSSY
mmetsp:Transcript_28936/g.43702  ORF Transcript_28936/g.43702 Transcript_28936/m.43702 type:complete len:592 (-) Transcript_28936:79-1854(-)|eukprot:CAMPEP_0178926012 /NCGR_PEP_ID=MMETSP0786-20121207/18265_1 /TAXON_ID=186022 /ORGANISM="Thalassionema frauenfeldii, Strain CCMP 1798" /LENGTH=591 /DNA_ID=CAMNT_0020601025 /DNA_START=51 /DNA_END=1826 /DNA_ORIENTATION=-